MSTPVWRTASSQEKRAVSPSSAQMMTAYRPPMPYSRRDSLQPGWHAAKVTNCAWTRPTWVSRASITASAASIASRPDGLSAAEECSTLRSPSSSLRCRGLGLD